MSTPTEKECQIEATLAPAGWLSRLGKLLMGLYQLLFVYLLVSDPKVILREDIPTNVGMWVGIALAFVLLSWTIDLGFDRKWGAKPFFVALFVVAVTAALGPAFLEGVWSMPLAIIIYAITVYVHGHMGFCHVLAAIIATPGCEMRAISQVWTRLRGGRHAVSCVSGSVE